jgi:hypothetical protein
MPSELDRVKRLGGTVRWYGLLDQDNKPMEGPSCPPASPLCPPFPRAHRIGVGRHGCVPDQREPGRGSRCRRPQRATLRLRCVYPVLAAEGRRASLIVLTSRLGTGDVDVTKVALEEGDQFIILASDGLWDVSPIQSLAGGIFSGAKGAVCHGRLR